MSPTSHPALPAGTALADHAQPVLTFYDDETGERTELTALELGTWAARTAQLLHEGCGLSTGDRIAVLLPAHWQTAAVLLGAWAAGLAVSHRPWATAGLTEPAEGRPAAVFVSAERANSWLEDVPEAPHRFVLPLGSARPAPEGYRDFLTEIGRYSGTLVGSYAPLRSTDAATADGTTYRQWGGLATEFAGLMDLRPGERLLIDTAAHEQPLTWLLAPLAAGASVVLCAHLNRAKLDARLAAERVTRVL